MPAPTSNRPRHPLSPRARVSLALAGCVVCLSAAPGMENRLPIRIAWGDTAPLHPQLEARGVDRTGFDAYVEHLRDEHARRVREGDIDHLVFYLLQSSRFTSLPPIEPALSAKALADSLPAGDRERFLREPDAAMPRVPDTVRRRAEALIAAFDAPGGDDRLAYFRQLAATVFPEARSRPDALLREYLRVMRFVYEKEVVARGSDRETVARLYRTRGLSTDTAVEAGYLVHLGLAIVRSLDPDRLIRRVLLVGPGLDLAPRTGLLDARPLESYQGWAVMDALLALGLSRPDTLELVAADINPRVVEHLQRATAAPPVLTLIGDIRETGGVTLSEDYRAYFARLGDAIGRADRAGPPQGLEGLPARRVRVAAGPAAALRPVQLDIVTERLEGSFDLVIATNILPYFDDVPLMLAMSNIAGMLGPGGVLLHNEPRPILGEITDALGLPFEQARRAVIATVPGAPPLADGVWIHRRVQG